MTEYHNLLRSLVFNLDDPALSNREMRLALTCATDASLIAANAGKALNAGFAPLRAASGLVAAHPNLYNEERVYDHLQKALKELDRASMEFTLLCEEAHGETMRKLLQEWQKLLGVTVAVSDLVSPVSNDMLDASRVTDVSSLLLFPVNP